jgi:hypothetical protein
MSASPAPPTLPATATTPALDRPRWRNLSLYLAAGWSGCFVMGVELLGGRLMAPYFGSSIFVWGALIAVFMAALAVGYLLGGQLSLRRPSITGLGLLLIAEAVLSLPIVFWSDALFDALSYAIDDPRYGALLASLLMYTAPTVVCGMVSPYAVRLLVDDVARSGHSAGRLYFASTLGSAAGTLLTTFYLVLLFEIDTIVLGLIAVSCAVGAGLCAGDRRRAR